MPIGLSGLADVAIHVTVTDNANNAVIVGTSNDETLRAGTALALSASKQTIIGNSSPTAIDTILGCTTPSIGTHATPSVLIIAAGAASSTVTTGTEDQDVVFGGAGSLTVTGGASVLLVQVSGPTTIHAGSGPSFVFGSTSATSITGGAGPLLILGGGNGTSSATAQGMQVTGGTGPSFVFGSAGHDTVITGGDGSQAQGGGLSSSLGNSAGHNAILIAGIGADIFVINPASAKAVEIFGFRTGIDHLDLRAVSASVPSATQAGGILDLHLANGQELLLVGVTSIGASDLVS